MKQSPFFKALTSLQVAASGEAFTRQEAERIRDWFAADPSAITEIDHEKNCLSERYFAVEEGGFDSFPCPVCEYKSRMNAMRQQMTNAGIATRYLDKRFSNLIRVEPFDRVAEACKRDNLARIREDGECLLLHGPPGQGKTQLAALIAKHAILFGSTALMVNLGRVCVRVRDGYDKPTGASEESVIQELTDVDFLVIDDLGAGESDSQKLERRILYLASESRQSAMRPTVITTNLSKQELVEYLGMRIFNRFMPLTSIEVNHGKNFRAPVDRKPLW